MVEIKSKLVKVGNSYYFPIPRALIQCKVVSLDKEMIVKVSENEGEKKHLVNGAKVYLNESLGYPNSLNFIPFLDLVTT